MSATHQPSKRNAESVDGDLPRQPLTKRRKHDQWAMSKLPRELKDKIWHSLLNKKSDDTIAALEILHLDDTIDTLRFEAVKKSEYRNLCVANVPEIFGSAIPGMLEDFEDFLRSSGHLTFTFRTPNSLRNFTALLNPVKVFGNASLLDDVRVAVSMLYVEGMGADDTGSKVHRSFKTMPVKDNLNDWQDALKTLPFQIRTLVIINLPISAHRLVDTLESLGNGKKTVAAVREHWRTHWREHCRDNSNGKMVFQWTVGCIKGIYNPRGEIEFTRAWEHRNWLMEEKAL